MDGIDRITIRSSVDSAVTAEWTQRLRLIAKDRLGNHLALLLKARFGPAGADTFIPSLQVEIDREWLSQDDDMITWLWADRIAEEIEQGAPAARIFKDRQQASNSTAARNSNEPMVGWERNLTRPQEHPPVGNPDLESLERWAIRRDYHTAPTKVDATTARRPEFQPPHLDDTQSSDPKYPSEPGFHEGVDETNGTSSSFDPTRVQSLLDNQLSSQEVTKLRQSIQERLRRLPSNLLEAAANGKPIQIPIAPRGSTERVTTASSPRIDHGLNPAQFAELWRSLLCLIKDQPGLLAQEDRAVTGDPTSRPALKSQSPREHYVNPKGSTQFDELAKAIYATLLPHEASLVDRLAQWHGASDAEALTARLIQHLDLSLGSAQPVEPAKVTAENRMDATDQDSLEGPATMLDPSPNQPITRLGNLIHTLLRWISNDQIDGAAHRELLEAAFAIDLRQGSFIPQDPTKIHDEQEPESLASHWLKLLSLIGEWLGLPPREKQPSTVMPTDNTVVVTNQRSDPTGQNELRERFVELVRLVYAKLPKLEAATRNERLQNPGGQKNNKEGGPESPNTGILHPSMDKSTPCFQLDEAYTNWLEILDKWSSTDTKTDTPILPNGPFEASPQNEESNKTTHEFDSQLAPDRERILAQWTAYDSLTTQQLSEDLRFLGSLLRSNSPVSVTGYLSGISETATLAWSLVLKGQLSVEILSDPLRRDRAALAWRSKFDTAWPFPSTQEMVQLLTALSGPSPSLRHATQSSRWVGDSDWVDCKAAGLALLVPFLPAACRELFESLEIDETHRLLACTARAHFLATLCHAEFPDTWLSDPMVLCLAGFNFSQPPDALPSIAAERRPTYQTVAHKVLRSLATAINGMEGHRDETLQAYFLLRAGRISRESTTTRLLQLKRGSLDMLVEASALPIGATQLAWTGPLEIRLLNELA